MWLEMFFFSETEIAGFRHPGHARSYRLHQIKSSRRNMLVSDSPGPANEAMDPKAEVSEPKQKNI